MDRPAPDLEADLQRVRALAHVLDTKFSIGGFRFGVEALIGLIPVVGDTVGAVVATYPLLIARRHGLGKVVLLRMAANLGVDWLVGLVPLAGDVFDAAYKANVKNLKLLEAAAEKKLRRQRAAH